MSSISIHSNTVQLQIPVSVGELVDKLTILALKRRHLRGEALGHAEREHQLLEQVFQAVAPRVPGDLQEQLGLVNSELWAVEDAIRACDRRGDFGPGFIELARSVYRLNDRRAAIKRAINLASGSALVEEKSYGTAPYSGGPDEVRPTT